MILSDTLIGLGGSVYLLSVFAQIIKIYKQKSADQISAWFICFNILAIILFMTGKGIAGFWFSASIDALIFVGFTIMTVQKRAYKGK